jgi:predicted ester cyclase
MHDSSRKRSVCFRRRIEMSEANKALVRRLVDDVINQRRFELLDELCVPSLAAQFRSAFTEFLEVFPDWEQGLVDLIAEGNQVVAHCTCSGTQQGPFIGQPATGKRMEHVHEVIFFWVEEGRFARVWSLEDTWDRMQQLGHVA